MAEAGENNPGPIPLYQVLEEEYDALHPDLAPSHNKSEQDPQKRLDAVVSLIHKQKHSALCVSGGGIRSATFALGIMQGLARCKLLEGFNYLSTVSGGGYIGSWLTSWIHRVDSEQGDNSAPEEKVAEDLAKRPVSKLHPEPTTVAHLREYSNYLSPKLSLLSADTWTLVATYVRNLILNWLVLLPLTAAALMVPRAFASILTNVRRNEVSPNYIYGVLIAGIGLGAIGISYIGLNRPSATRRNNSQRRFLWNCLLPLALSAFLLTIYWAWHIDDTEGNPNVGLLSFVGLGIIINLLGFIISAVTDKPKRILELPAVFISGAVSGWVIYLVATTPGFLFLASGGLQLKTYICLAVPVLLLIFLVGEILLVGLISFITSDEDREWWSREDAWILIVAVGWAAISSLVIFGPIALGEAEAYIASIGGISGLITALLGRSSATPANKKQKEQASTTSLVKDFALKLAAPVFTIFLLILLVLAVTLLIWWFDDSEASALINSLSSGQVNFGLSTEDLPAGSIGQDHYDHLEVIFKTPLKLVLLIAALLLAISAIMSFFININRFSLHSMYRNRLIRAYLGASNTKRAPNKFTNFDNNDNLLMGKLWPENSAGKPRKSLMHVINIALNLVGGENLAWQERKAESFTVSPLHCGNKDLGYRKSNEYGGADGITIGTAMAISGAAASPNMGYHSSTFITFLMMLFNARLGWWLGNPGAAGNKTYKHEGPYLALRPLIAEALGMTSDRSPYVYLSDGGHFENLGLYEMVLRRCHFIVVSDGSEDKEGTLDSLGNAVRKIRIDTGIPIEFPDKFCIFPRSQEDKEWYLSQGRYCAIGKIRYSCVDDGAEDGILIYLKPAFYGNEPRDIYEYAKANDAFPHESTADQFFTESQFESYRMLGSHIVELICGEGLAASNSYDFLRKSAEHRFKGEETPCWIDEWLKKYCPLPDEGQAKGPDQPSNESPSGVLPPGSA